VTALILAWVLAAGADGGAIAPAGASAATRDRVIELLGRPKAPTTSEVKAIDPQAVTTLAGVARDRAISEKSRARAIELWAKIDGPGAVESLRSLVDDSQPAVRIAVSGALGRVGTPEAREVLRGRLDSETDSAVRAALERDLARGAP
jgi:HEAT repeat protein